MSILKTYREAISDYAWHPESKFENAERYDVGLTRRRHIEAVAIEYIGKEANRWEEQFYLGELPEAQIEYGFSKKALAQIIFLLADAARLFTQTTFANRAGITRQELIAILKGTSVPRMRTVRALMNALSTLRADDSNP